MMKKKIVFIVNAITITRCIKRIEEFVDNGYDVDVYGFDRGGEVYAMPTKFKIKVIGEHNVKQNYFARLIIIFKSLLPVFKKYKHQDVLFYYFFFDIAFTSRLLCKRTFVYEESDLPYTSIHVKIIQRFLAFVDKRIIQKSFLTVMTSEGFIDYHFGDKRPNNIIVIPNRVNPKLKDCIIQKKNFDCSHLTFAFVGGFRYQSVLNFAVVIAERFPQHEFHAFGVILDNNEICNKLCELYPNIHFHGKFNNPGDLPEIYSGIDLVIAAYDSTSINAQYAEPNKLYEAVFFHTPIIVSSGTFLARKVGRLGIGYDVKALDKKEIVEFIQNLKEDDLIQKSLACEKLPIDYVINENPELFKYLNNN